MRSIKPRIVISQHPPVPRYQLVFFFALLGMGIVCLFTLWFFSYAYIYDVIHGVKYGEPLPISSWARSWEGGSIPCVLLCLLVLGSMLMPLSIYYLHTERWYGKLGLFVSSACLTCCLVAIIIIVVVSSLRCTSSSRINNSRYRK